MEELSHEKITVHQGGKSQRKEALEVILRRQRDAALKGDIKSAEFFLKRRAALDSGTSQASDPSADDREVLEAYEARIAQRLAEKDKK